MLFLLTSRLALTFLGWGRGGVMVYLDLFHHGQISSFHLLKILSFNESNGFVLGAGRR
jgi:hypothetical protein